LRPGAPAAFTGRAAARIAATGGIGDTGRVGMTGAQGDVGLIEDPVAQELLQSQQLARLAYTWSDGTPRVVPIWFHWTGTALTFGTPVKAPKLLALRHDPRVAVTIDDSTAWPYRALLVRGDASVEMRDDVTEEYAASARRYFGEEQGAAWVDQLRGQPMAHLSVTPGWVGVLDFETRFPSALSA
jgi:pyridoxamine 5'-phosphate oxidase-like protein